MVKSFQEYLVAFGYWGLLVVADFIASGVGAYLDVSGAVSFPRWIWMALLFAGLAIAPLFPFHKMRLARDELIQERDDLLHTLDQNEARAEALRELSELYLRGVQFRNEAWHNPPDDEEAWWNEVQTDWIGQIKVHMDIIHRAAFQTWHTLGEVNMRAFGGVGINRPGLQHQLSMLTQLYEKLERYINERT